MKYKVVIVGGGTSGCAAAYYTAKLGLKTLLIEKNSYLGGTISGSLVIPAMMSVNSDINNDFFRTFTSYLHTLGGQVTYFDGNCGWFNPELAKIALDSILSDAGVDIFFNTYVNDIFIADNLIKRISVSRVENINLVNEEKNAPELSVSIETNIEGDNSNDLLSEYIETDYIIDATGSQIICQKAGCRFIDDGEHKQPSSLRFIAAGVNLAKFKDFILELDDDRNATTGGLIGNEIHLSTACTWDKEWALTPIFQKGLEEGILKESDLAYFQVFTIPGMPGSIAFNCPRFSKNISSNEIHAYSMEIIEARKGIVRLINFCKKYFPGFENAYISEIAPEVGIRVSNRPLGRYVYTIEDLKSGRTFSNPVLVSNYPIDVHSDKKEDAKLEKVYKEYQLPIESLISADYENLFFVGRSVSCDFYSQSALRIIPSCFSMGEGLAKYIAALSN